MNKEQLFSIMERETKLMVDICKKKNSDYANSDDPFFNFKRVEELGIVTTEQGFLTRMTDKLCRIISLTQKESKNENPAVLDGSKKDTLRDLANYCLLFLAYEESKEKRTFL